ncbi:MAG: TolC family protein [Planctomycetota bacterium]|nr:TolC family protein [Planctomycetota bacterium]
MNTHPMMTSDRLTGRTAFRRDRRFRRAVNLLVVLICFLSGLPGCSRQFWRRQADTDSYNVIEERQADDRWYLPRIDIEPDPRSRFYDPYALDRGPLPPDDPAAHEYMHEVGTWIPGYKSWHKFGQAFSVENPQWYDAFEMKRVNNTFREYAGNDTGKSGSIQLAAYSEEESPESDGIDDSSADERGTVPLDLEGNADDVDEIDDVYIRPEVNNLTLQQAIELSQIHSRDYQFQIENVYLDALALTLGRFQFDVQYIAPAIGLTQSTNGNGGNSTLGMAAGGGLTQVLPTGAQWSVELLNNTLWLFSGDNQTSTSSLLSYSLVQPLMRGAGRKIVLASLTQQERNLLYSVRVLARFRQTFFNDITSSYLSLLQTRQGIINQRNNIFQTEAQLERSRVLESMAPPDVSEPLQALPDGVEIPPELAPKVSNKDIAPLLVVDRTITPNELEQLRGLSDDVVFQQALNDIIDRLNPTTNTLTIVQLETNLANSRNSLLSREVSYQNSLDQYKFQLGLPPDSVLTIDEAFLEPFTLIADQLFDLEKEVNQFVSVWGALSDNDPTLENLRTAATQLGTLIEHVERRGMNLVLSDKQRFLDANARILADKDPEDRERLLVDLERDQRILESTQQDLARLIRAWDALQKQLGDEQLPQQQRQMARRVIKDLQEDLLKVTQTLQVIQVGIRVELIELNAFDMDMEEAIAYAVDNRLDLMNNRAAVMDARRAVEVAANQLEGVMNVVVEGDINTPTGTRPFDFRAVRSTFRTGLQFTTPVNLVSQRNNYRASLIAYQRARRSYMQAEDSVKIQVRQDWRQLKVLKKNFEIQRRAIRSSATQLDQTIARASDPSQAANLDNQGLNLINALNAVLNNQNTFIGIWVNYEQNRLNFYQDIGMMEIDSQGIWDDAYYQHWLRTGKPSVTTASTPPTPQGARRVFTPDLLGRTDPIRHDEPRSRLGRRPGVVLASQQEEQVAAAPAKIAARTSR